MREQKCKLQLRCTLTSEELAQYSRQMADALRTQFDKEAQLKSTAALYKSEIESCKAEAQEMAEKVRSGYEFRQVECKIIYDWENKEKSWIRTDTNEIVKTDTISESELQEEMELQAKSEPL